MDAPSLQVNVFLPELPEAYRVLAILLNVQAAISRPPIPPEKNKVKTCKAKKNKAKKWKAKS